MTALILNMIDKGNVTITETKFIRFEIMRAAKEGNLLKLKKLCDKY